MRRHFASLVLLTLSACATGDDASTQDVDDTGSGRGRGGIDAAADTGGTADGADAGSGADVETGADAVTPDVPTRPDVGGADSGPAPDAGGACTASTLDGAIACQVAANDLFVDGFCDCFTDVGYDGDRAACVADQPDASAFEPDTCVRAALLADEPAAVANSLCYAAAARELAACIAVCPPTEEDFDACFTTLEAAFDACDAAAPPALLAAIDACAEEPVDPPAGVEAATTALVAQRDDYVRGYCGCFGAVEFSGTAECTTSLQSRWDPGLSACEQAAFAANETAALPFLQCLTESFLIAETACIDCPARASIEYELCADPAVDIQFCFAEAAPALQDALVACGG
jgi:hypothetical protein